jgi:fructose/tagatose bisphosphate aldolase
VNIRTQTFDMAAAMCRAAQSLDAGAIVFELARSEQEYTYQRPGEFITSVLAGCISANWRGPVFVQGDHYQFNAKKYAADPEGTTEAIRRLTREAIGVGYGNIDIDSSTLVDLSLPTVDEQQRTNYQRAAEISAVIREVEPRDTPVSIGGEIGEVGKQNSTEEELRAYLDGYAAELRRLAGDVPGLSKVSVQTGTSHGGVPLPGGGVAEVNLDFGTLERLSAVCREYGMAGAVQHGASTLPDELFNRFPQVETAEIHLATGFQNLLYEHPAFPRDLLAQIEAWCHENAADERKEGESDTQFLYKTRKKALGPFKRELWEMPTKDEIIAAQEQKFRYFFEQLGVGGSRDMVERYIRAPRRSMPLPSALADLSPAR